MDELKIGGLSDAVFDPEWATMGNFTLLEGEPMLEAEPTNGNR